MNSLKLQIVRPISRRRSVRQDTIDSNTIVDIKKGCALEWHPFFIIVRLLDTRNDS